MFKTLIIGAGIVLLLVQSYLLTIPVSFQFAAFIAGIVLLGVPHGAADLLVACQNKVNLHSRFSQGRFFLEYLGRLALSALFLWFFPVPFVIIFVLLAAWHFGQTDLSILTARGSLVKLLIVAYGLFVVGAMLLNHFDQVSPYYQLFYPGKKAPLVFLFIGQHRYFLLNFTGCLFSLALLLYASFNFWELYKNRLYFLKLFVLLWLVWQLPLLLGFTFYFIIWHSSVSLLNIVKYLSGSFSVTVIARQMLKYSLLALTGMGIAAYGSYKLADSRSIIIYAILGLAILTTPHMQVMDEMYRTMFSKHRKDKLLSAI